jgi:hypothetical protein
MTIQSNTSNDQGLMTVSERLDEALVEAGLTAKRQTFAEAVGGMIREVKTVSKKTGKTSTRLFIDVSDEGKTVAETQRELRSLNKKWSVKRAKAVAIEAVHGKRGIRWARAQAILELAREEYAPDVFSVTTSGNRLSLSLVRDVVAVKPTVAPKAPTWEELVGACNSASELQKAMAYLASKIDAMTAAESAAAK